ncbi:MAG: DUF4381 domain-containing protein [Halioglobus sp.]
MNPQDPLAALHPLRDPAAIGWWPLAPGWWMLIALVIALLLLCAWLWLRRYRACAYRRQAQIQLDQLIQSWRSDNDTSAYLGATNALLKSVCLHAFPWRDVAAINGSRWIDFLNQTMPEKTDRPRFDALMADAVYQADAAIDCEAIHVSAVYWIDAHRVAS